jgi:hypothetical protein
MKPAPVGLWLGVGLALAGTAHAQQFSSDSWIAKDHGTATVIDPHPRAQPLLREEALTARRIIEKSEPLSSIVF